MAVPDPAEAVQVLDLLLKFFGDGEHWVKGRVSDRRGNRCLVGALDFVSGHHAVKADAAARYLADEISTTRDGDGQVRDCARFRAGLRRAIAGDRHPASDAVLRRDSLSDFNDGCRDFTELRGLILQALAAAMNDAGRAPARPSLPIEADKLVMAYAL